MLRSCTSHLRWPQYKKKKKTCPPLSPFLTSTQWFVSVCSSRGEAGERMFTVASALILEKEDAPLLWSLRWRALRRREKERVLVNKTSVPSCDPCKSPPAAVCNQSKGQTNLTSDRYDRISVQLQRGSGRRRSGKRNFSLRWGLLQLFFPNLFCVGDSN